MSVQNTARIQQQNEKPISVIIGNPSYNAHQENFNQRNANRLYKGIDKAIKETYIKEGTAQNQIVVYDMLFTICIPASFAEQAIAWVKMGLLRSSPIDRLLLPKPLMAFPNVSTRV